VCRFSTVYIFGAKGRLGDVLSSELENSFIADDIRCNDFLRIVFQWRNS
jgi:hypothetical protein